jgi:hypothetical protein
MLSISSLSDTQREHRIAIEMVNANTIKYYLCKYFLINLILQGTTGVKSILTLKVEFL